MLMLKSSATIRTNRHLTSLRGSRASTGPPMRHVEERRMCLERIKLINKQMHRLWVNEQWAAHFEWVGRLRVLPPSARVCQTRARAR